MLWGFVRVMGSNLFVIFSKKIILLFLSMRSILVTIVFILVHYLDILNSTLMMITTVVLSDSDSDNVVTNSDVVTITAMKVWQLLRPFLCQESHQML